MSFLYLLLKLISVTSVVAVLFVLGAMLFLWLAASASAGVLIGFVFAAICATGIARVV